MRKIQYMLLPTQWYSDTCTNKKYGSHKIENN